MNGADDHTISRLSRRHLLFLLGGVAAAGVQASNARAALDVATGAAGGISCMMS